jgi:hypothetical protein
MRLMTLPKIRGSKVPVAAFTLAEVVVCVFIMMLLFGSIISSYIQTSYRAEWSGYSLAAEALALQQLEHAKAAVWDTQQTPVNDEIIFMATNPPIRALLDLPVTGTNYVYATIYTKPTLILNGVYSNYLVKVDAVWPFRWKNQTVLFTNTVACYYAPE